jgi:hypothetical protein
MLRDRAVSTALGTKAVGILFVMAGIGVMTRNSFNALIVGAVMMLIGAAIFVWSFRR